MLFYLNGCCQVPLNSQVQRPYQFILPSTADCLHSSQCVRAQSLQLCPTPCDPMDCSPPGSSVLGDSPDKDIGVGCIALLQRISQIQGLNLRVLCLLNWQADSLPTITTWEACTLHRHGVFSGVLFSYCFFLLQSSWLS